MKYYFILFLLKISKSFGNEIYFRTKNSLGKIFWVFLIISLILSFYTKFVVKKRKWIFQICELQGKNFFDLLDDASAESISGAISTEVLHSVPISTGMHNTTAIQETVTTKKLRRKLLVTGYLKKITHNKDRLCMPDTIAESGTDNSTTRIITIIVSFLFLNFCLSFSVAWIMKKLKLLFFKISIFCYEN